MILEKIIAISGKPGLYELLSQTRSGFLVKSLVDGKRQSISMKNNVSVLNEIAVYTYSEEIPLKQIFDAIYKKEDKGTTISHKSAKNELENYFEEILPEYDKERVYASDIKKIVQWYNLLHKSDLIEKVFENDSSENKETASNEEAE